MSEDRDLIALLAEAENALRAIRRGNSGVQRGVDPAREAKRLHDALEAEYQLGEKAFPGSRSRES